MANVPVQVTTVLVVPCYNESSRFHAHAFAQALEKDRSLGFLFVNDGSQDQTEEVLKEFVGRYPDQSSLVNLTPNQGKAEAVRVGILSTGKNHGQPWSTSDLVYIGYWDADLATPFSELPRFLQTFQEHPHLKFVLGARVNLLGRKIHRHTYRHYLGRVFATAASYILHLPIYDTQCGAKIFRYEESILRLFDEAFVSAWIFDVELLARFSRSLKKERAKPHDLIYELPLLTWNDVAGSKLKLKDFLKATVSLFRLAKLYPRFDHLAKEGPDHVR